MFVRFLKRDTLLHTVEVALIVLHRFFCSLTNPRVYYYQRDAEKVAFGRLMAPDENMISAVYLGAQHRTSLHHTTRLLGNSNLWRQVIGGDL